MNLDVCSHTTAIIQRETALPSFGCIQWMYSASKPSLCSLELPSRTLAPSIFLYKPQNLSVLSASTFACCRICLGGFTTNGRSSLNTLNLFLNKFLVNHLLLRQYKVRDAYMFCGHSFVSPWSAPLGFTHTRLLLNVHYYK